MARILPRTAPVLLSVGIALGLCHSSAAMLFVRIPKVGTVAASQDSAEALEPRKKQLGAD